jgi:hypothetical protein
VHKWLLVAQTLSYEKQLQYGRESVHLAEVCVLERLGMLFVESLCLNDPDSVAAATVGDPLSACELTGAGRGEGFSLDPTTSLDLPSEESFEVQ